MRVRINTTSTGARIGSGINAGPPTPRSPRKKGPRGKDARIHRGEDPESSLFLSLSPLPSPPAAFIASRHRMRGFGHILGIPKESSLALLVSKGRYGRD